MTLFPEDPAASSGRLRGDGAPISNNPQEIQQAPFGADPRWAPSPSSAPGQNTMPIPPGYLPEPVGPSAPAFVQPAVQHPVAPVSGYPGALPTSAPAAPSGYGQQPASYPAPPQSAVPGSSSPASVDGYRPYSFAPPAAQPVAQQDPSPELIAPSAGYSPEPFYQTGPNVYASIARQQPSAASPVRPPQAASAASPQADTLSTRELRALQAAGYEVPVTPPSAVSAASAASVGSGAPGAQEAQEAQAEAYAAQQAEAARQAQLAQSAALAQQAEIQAQEARARAEYEAQQRARYEAQQRAEYEARQRAEAYARQQEQEQEQERQAAAAAAQARQQAEVEARQRAEAEERTRRDAEERAAAQAAPAIPSGYGIPSIREYPQLPVTPQPLADSSATSPVSYPSGPVPSASSVSYPSGPVQPVPATEYSSGAVEAIPAASDADASAQRREASAPLQSAPASTTARAAAPSFGATSPAPTLPGSGAAEPGGDVFALVSPPPLDDYDSDAGAESPAPVPVSRRARRAAEQAEAPSSQHWSEEADHMTREPAAVGLGDRLSGSGGPSSGPVATPALVLGAPESLLGPLNSTGEIILTGSINLPRSYAATGGSGRLLDDSDIDHLDASYVEVTDHTAPVRAARAVGSQYPTTSIVTAKGRFSSWLPTILAVGGAVLFVSVVGVLVGVWLNLF